MRQIRIVVDGENAAEVWWDAARASKSAPPEMSLLFDAVTVTQITVSPAAAERIRTWAESLPGWDADDAPEYAPHPLLIP